MKTKSLCWEIKYFVRNLNHFDGNLNILDIVMVVSIILGSNFTDEQSCAADLNEDSDINILDIVTIISLILNS